MPDLLDQPGDDVAPATFDLDAWIDGSKPTERSVTLVGRGDLMAEAEAVMRRYDIAKQVPEGDRGVNDESPEALAARLEQLHAEMESSRTTWYLHALTPEESKAAADAAEKAGEGADQAAHLLASAVSKIVMPNGAVATNVTPAQIAKIRAKLGHQEVMRLMATLSLAMSEEPQIQAPFSRTSSEGPAGTE